MGSRIERRVTEEPCAITNVRKVRMERVTEKDFANLNGEVVTRVTARYLDGTQAVILMAGKDQRSVDMQRWEAVPARTSDVLDFGRLEAAAAALSAQMAAFDAQNPPSAEQVVSWLQSWQNIQQWRKEAEARFSAADGQIGHVLTMLRQFL